MIPAPKAAPRIFAVLESRQLGVAWVVAAILGALVISSTPGINPPRLIIPVGIMVAYGVFVFNRSSGLFATASEAYRHSLVGQLADSMYFMGFVWTLWALIDSFVIHQAPAADAIFRTFGYALITTATGMFCRLAILQFKYTATEQSHEAQASVEELLQQFTVVLESTRRVLEQWHITLTAGTNAITGANTGFISSVERARNELTATMTTATNDYLSMLTATQTRLERAIEDTGRNLEKRLQDGIAGGLKDFGQQTAVNLEQIREATSGLVSTLKRTNTGLGKSIGDLTIKVGETAVQVGTAQGTITAATQQLSTSLNDAVVKLNGGATALRETMTTASESITIATNTMAESFGGLAGAIKREITVGLSDITVAPRVLATVDESVLNTAITPVREGFQKMDEQATGIREALKKISEQADGVEQTLNAKHPMSPQIDGTLQALEKAIQAAVATVTSHLERLENEIQKLREHERGVGWRLPWR